MVKKIAKWIGILVGVVLLLAILLIGVLTIKEYRPEDEETLDVAAAVSGAEGRQLHEGDSLTVMTWNIGYGALGSDADFFMDGGSGVNTATEEQVQQHMAEIQSRVEQTDPDVVFFQEVDLDSTRSHHVNEADYLVNGLSGYNSSFAYNFKVLFVPYPLPPIGEVNGGILTISRIPVASAARIQLPCPFSYPIRVANLKRCLMVSRIPLAESDRELVLVNLHLEAYDDGEGKAAQTAQLRELLEEEAAKGNYVIAGGDFNQSFSNIDISMYPQQPELWAPAMIDVEDFSKDWSFWMDNSVPTCRSLDQPFDGADAESFQYYMIDGFITSGNIMVESVETQDMGFENSDHNPVVMKVILQE